MASHALGAADREFVGMVAEDLLENGSLGLVIQRGRRAMGIDVAHLLGSDAGVLQGKAHTGSTSGTFRVGAVSWWASPVQA